MTKINDKDTQNSRALIYPKAKIDSVANFKKEPGYHYETVINYDKTGLRRNVEHYEEVGFEICYEKEAPGDNRAFKPDSNKEDSTQLIPVMRRTSDGFIEVLMRIPEDKWKKHHLKNAIAERERYLKSVGKKAVTMNRQADGLPHISLEDDETSI